MQEQIIYDLLKDELMIQDEPLRKLIWVLDKNFYTDGDFKQNVLLIGERGSGKTTMLRETAKLMEIPMGEVYNMFVPNGFNVSLFYNGVSQMMSDSESGKGILLLHDFQDSFIYGSSDAFNSMIASGTIDLGDGVYWDVSDITFVGEIDTNNVDDLFPRECNYLDDLENNNFKSPVLNMIKDFFSQDNVVYEDENGNRNVNLGFYNYITKQIKERFLSKVCSDVFNRRIFMDNMGSQEIMKALKSPHSALNLYKNDLTYEYINSDEFVNKVVYNILESGEGLHYLMMAIEEAISHDCKYNHKVLKKGSLLGLKNK